MIFTRWDSTAEWMNLSACSFSSIYLSPLSKNSHLRKNPSVNNEHLCTADTAVKTKIENIPTNNIHLCTVDTTVSKRIQTLCGKEMHQHPIHMSPRPITETSYFRENPVKTFSQQRTPVHSWQCDKHKNETMYGKRQLNHTARQVHVYKPKPTLPSSI